MNKDIAIDFYHSINGALNQFQDLDFFDKWFQDKNDNGSFEVTEVEFSELDKWGFEEGTQNLVHDSGKFFSIIGLRIQSNHGDISSWEQPIINQPEIGILGIIVMKFNGVYHFLMQAKMEPGNLNILQVSPTIQATKSNYTQVHKGKQPEYLDYFLDKSKSSLICDQLQPEQGGRFLKKRNRNIVIEVSEDIEVHDDFKWLTLNDLKELAKRDNILNMDTRSVLSTIQIKKELNSITDSRSMTEQLLWSASSNNIAMNSIASIHSWIAELKTRIDVDLAIIPLSEVKGWSLRDKEIRDDKNDFFSVNAVSVVAGSREVVSWMQPLIKDLKQGLIGLVTKEINGALHFLMQGCFEPGNRDIIDIGPTVSYSNWEERYNNGGRPKFIEHFIDLDKNNVILDSVQSEEGGRFYHICNRNIVVNAEGLDENDIPSDYIWMTLEQIYIFIESGMVNIEGRSLISCLPYNLD
jgi:oxidase EvaA